MSANAEKTDSERPPRGDVSDKPADQTGAATAIAVRVEQYLKGLRYPAKREEVLARARLNAAPAEIMQLLERLREKEFPSPDDLDDALRDEA
jgi:hypothetical protein